jgi:hypothetical protein
LIVTAATAVTGPVWLLGAGLTGHLALMASVGVVVYVVLKRRGWL